MIQKKRLNKASESMVDIVSLSDFKALTALNELQEFLFLSLEAKQDKPRIRKTIKKLSVNVVF